MSFCRLIAGLAENKPFAEPIRLDANGIIGPTGVDEHASALLRFAICLTAETTCAITATQWAHRPSSSGRRERSSCPILGSREATAITRIELYDRARRQGPETVTSKPKRPTYAIEAELVRT